MNVVDRIRYRGWLAPGIVLNAVAEGNVLFVPNNSRDGSLLSPNLAKMQAVQLVGKVLSVCWMIPLVNYAYVEDKPGEAVRHDGFDRLNPFADPCVLAAPCLFDGEVVVVTGDDVARVTFQLPPVRYSSVAQRVVSDPILPAVYLPSSVGTALIAGVDPSNAMIMHELQRTISYLPVRLPDDSPSIELYGGSTVAPFIGLQRYDMNLAGLYAVDHGTPQHPDQMHVTYHLKVRLRQPITVDGVAVKTVLLSLKSPETFVLDKNTPFPRVVANTFDFFKSGRGLYAPLFSTYLIPGTHQVSAQDTNLEAVLSVV